MKNKKIKRLLVLLTVFFIFNIIGYAISFFNLILLVPTSSMEPTIPVMQPIKAQRITNGELNNITYGDIVVFKAPDYDGFRFKGFLMVKRVIGLGGDTISFKLDGAKYSIYRNNTKLIEPYTINLEDYWKVNHRVGGNTYVVPNGEVFLLGDNRGNSVDSRYWGTIPLDDILGKVKWRD